MEIPVFNANSVDTDQTPQNAAFDLGLHCLSTSFLGTPGIEWVNNKYNILIIKDMILKKVQFGHLRHVMRKGFLSHI